MHLFRPFGSSQSSSAGLCPLFLLTAPTRFPEDPVTLCPFGFLRAIPTVPIRQHVPEEGWRRREPALHWGKSRMGAEPLLPGFNSTLCCTGNSGEIVHPHLIAHGNILTAKSASALISCPGRRPGQKAPRGPVQSQRAHEMGWEETPTPRLCSAVELLALGVVKPSQPHPLLRLLWELQPLLEPPQPEVWGSKQAWGSVPGACTCFLERNCTGRVWSAGPLRGPRVREPEANPAIWVPLKRTSTKITWERHFQSKSTSSCCLKANFKNVLFSWNFITMTHRTAGQDSEALSQAGPWELRLNGSFT